MRKEELVVGGDGAVRGLDGPLRRINADNALAGAKIDYAALADETVSDADRRESARGCAKASGAIRAALAACPAATPPPSS